MSGKTINSKLGISDSNAFPLSHMNFQCICYVNKQMSNMSTMQNLSFNSTKKSKERSKK